MTAPAHAATGAGAHSGASPAVPVMLLMSTFGMIAGLFVDTRTVPLEILAGICAGADSFVSSVSIHLSVFPATHLLMVAGATVAALAKPRETLAVSCYSGALCGILMLSGMVAGGWLASGLETLVPSARMLAGMALGMAAGMLAAPPFSAGVLLRRPRELLPRT